MAPLSDELVRNLKDCIIQAGVHAHLPSTPMPMHTIDAGNNCNFLAPVMCMLLASLMMEDIMTGFRFGGLCCARFMLICCTRLGRGNDPLKE